MIKKIKVSLSEDISITASGQVLIDGSIYSGIDAFNPKAPTELKKDALRALAVVIFLEEYHEKKKEEEILTIMYELFTIFHGYEWNDEFFATILDGSGGLHEQSRWRALAERVIEMKEV